MLYVYLLRSMSTPEQVYVGRTEDISQRLSAHNSGNSSHTAKFAPWELITYIAFSNKAQAIAFERYLKSGSGRAFRDKRLL